MLNNSKSSHLLAISETSKKIIFSFGLLKKNTPELDVDFLLFLLSLKKIGFKPLDIIISDEILSSLSIFIGMYVKKHNAKYDIFFEEYLAITKSIPTTELLDVFLYWEAINPQILRDNFIEIFNEIIVLNSSSEDQDLKAIAVKDEVCDLIYQSLDLADGANIYDAFAENAFLGSQMNPQHKYFGHTSNKLDWNIGMLRLLACESNFELVSDSMGEGLFFINESIENLIGKWNPYGMSFDVIFAVRYFNENVKINNFEIIIDKGLEDLNVDGTLIILVPENFDFSNYNQFVQSVIEIPQELLPSNSIRSKILVLKNSASKTNNHIDGKEFLNVKLSLETKMVLLENRDNEKVSIEKISLYKPFGDLANLFDNYEGTPLSDFVTEISRQEDYTKTHGIRVRPRDLKNNRINFLILANNTDNSEELNKVDAVIEQSCILINAVGGDLKATFFQFTDTPIFISEDIIALKVDETKALTSFVTRELYQDYFFKQLKIVRSFCWPDFIIENFLKIKLDLPYLEDQKNIVGTHLKIPSMHTQVKNDKEKFANLFSSFGLGKMSSLFYYFEQHENISSSLEDFLKKQQEHFDKIMFNEFVSLKHSLGKPNGNILGHAKNLIINFQNINSEEFKKFDERFQIKYNCAGGIVGALTSIKNSANFISTVLKKGEKGLHLDDYPKKLVSINQLNQLILDLSNSAYNFKLKFDLLEDTDTDFFNVSCNLNLLKILFDNILSNANNYAFESVDEKNIVLIETKFSNENLEIIIKNNGIPFSDKIQNKEDFITKFKTSNENVGTGIGGYDIDRIATYFGNANWELVKSDSLYPVIFKFSFAWRSHHPVYGDTNSTISYIDE